MAAMAAAGAKKLLLASFLTPAETKNIGATIRISQEIWCLPYAGFFLHYERSFTLTVLYCTALNCTEVSHSSQPQSTVPFEYRGLK